MEWSREGQIVYQIVGAAMEVHNELGCGFNELIYQEALAIELTKRGIPFEREKAVHVFYKGEKLSKFYRPDFICDGDIIVELKALTDIGNHETAQVLGYLKATGYKKGLLLNFGSISLQHKSFINSQISPINTAHSANEGTNFTN